MDNLTHTLAGAALGEAGLKRQTRLGMATLMIASNLPDIDVAVFATDVLPMSFRRGWTHGVLAMAVLPALLAIMMYGWGRARRRESPVSGSGPPLVFSGLLLLAYIGTWLHVFMDWLNTYGVRLLMPFSNRWFYGDALYIVDPVLYVLLGVAVFGGRLRAAREQGRRWTTARIGVALAALYIAVMMVSNGWARAEVRRQLARAGEQDARFMVSPVIGWPQRREVIVDTGDRYEKGFLWFEPAPHFRPAGYGVETNRADPAVRQAARSPLFTAYLQWSRFPFFVVDRSGDRPRVFLNDYRYSGPGAREGWAGVSSGGEP